MKIVCLTGSQTPPATPQEIIDWLNTGSVWGIVIIGYQWKYRSDVNKFNELIKRE